MNLRTLAAGALLALAVAACGSSAATSAPASASAPTTPTGSTAPAGSPAASMAANATSITERDFRFDTPDVTVAGTPVTLTVTNAGPTVHDLTIRDSSGQVLGETDDLKPGASGTVTAALPVGTYTIFCSLPGHESLGLKGTLTVTK